MPDFHVTFRDLLHALNLRHGTDGFTAPPKEGSLILLDGKRCMSEVTLSKNECCKNFEDAIFRDGKMFLRKNQNMPFRVCSHMKRTGGQ
jgi:hypothetical protein